MCSQAKQRLVATIAGQKIEYLGLGAVHWPEQRMLVVADLHLGKSTTFRRGGIPIPEGPDQQTLHRLRQAIDWTEAEHVLILGDFVHSRGGWTDRLVSQICEYQRTRPQVSWRLVLGNHDRGSVARLKQFPMELLDEPYRIGPFVLWHHPPEPKSPSEAQTASQSLNSPGVEIEGESTYFFAGHLHPRVAVSSCGRSKTRLKCFWQSQRGLILPAFGEFTGGFDCQPVEEDRIIGIADGELIDLSELVLRCRR